MPKMFEIGNNDYQVMPKMFEYQVKTIKEIRIVDSNHGGHQPKI